MKNDAHVWQLGLVILSISLLFITIQVAHASPTVTWDAPNHSINDGAVTSGVTPQVQIYDPNLDTNGISGETISVLINSTSYQSGITLTLTEQGDTGTFTNDNLIFTNGTGTVSAPSSLTVGVVEPSLAGTGKIISGPSTTKGIQVFSTTNSATGIYMNLTETGSHTGIFTNTLKITTGSSVNGSAINVHTGDIVTIKDRDTAHNSDWTSLLVTPNSNPAVGALPAKFGDSVTAIYQGIKDTTILNSGTAPGGGGGGLIRPSLVLDIIAAIGGSSYIVSPPSFGGNYYHFSDGLTLNQGENGNKETYDISKYNAEIPKQIMTRGKIAHMTFKTFEAYNPTSVVGMTLYFIPRGQDLNTDISKSIASIEWKKGNLVQVDDPNNILSNVQASSQTDGKFQYTKFVFDPTKSYDKMSFIVRAWNDHRYVMETRLHDAANITTTSVTTLPAGIIKYDNFNDLMSSLDNDGYLKPVILSHIHDTNSVFGSSDAGKVFWLHDTINKKVTLVILDKNGNELGRTTSSLELIPSEAKRDYGFMKFTTKQLNRCNEEELQHSAGIEATKAMFTALEKGIMPYRNWSTPEIIFKR